MQKAHVVIQTAFIGDLFLSIPTLNRLRKQYPEHQIFLVCKQGLGDFFLKAKWVDQVFEVEKGNSGSYNKAVKKINEHDIDHVFCLHRSFRSALLSFRIKAKHKIGMYTSLTEGFYKRFIFHTTLLYPKAWPDVIRQMFVLTPVDSDLKKKINQRDWSYLNLKNQAGRFESIPEEFKFPQVEAGTTTLSNSSAQAQNQQKVVAIYPGSVWATKKWTHQGYADVANQLIAKDYKVCLMGAPSDRVDSDAIKKLAPDVQDLTGQMSLCDSAFYTQNFDLIICNDSAPAHIAASLGRPVLCVFGPTVLDFGFRPWNDLSHVVELNHLDCRPCGPHGHKQCPLGHHDCMKKIDSNTVIKTALDMLGAV